MSLWEMESCILKNLMMLMQRAWIFHADTRWNSARAYRIMYKTALSSILVPRLLRLVTSDFD